MTLAHCQPEAPLATVEAGCGIHQFADVRYEVSAFITTVAAANRGTCASSSGPRCDAELDRAPADPAAAPVLGCTCCQPRLREAKSSTSKPSSFSRQAQRPSRFSFGVDQLSGSTSPELMPVVDAVHPFPRRLRHIVSLELNTLRSGWR
jgi:hypothetical protein